MNIPTTNALQSRKRGKGTLQFKNLFNWHRYEQAEHQMNILINRDIQDITLDFSQVKGAYPDGIVPLIAEVTRLKDNEDIRFNVIPPKEPQLLSVFKRSGWLHYLDPKKWEKPTGVPLIYFRNESELNDAVNTAIEVYQQRLKFAEGVFDAFKWALNEIATNVLKHSKAGEGWIQVVTDLEQRQLKLIVCDSGVGVPVSMGKMENLYDSDQFDEMTLKKAIGKHDNSKAKHGQVKGLAGAVAIAQHNEGIFAITSGRGHVKVVKGSVEVNKCFPAYNGTYVRNAIRY